MWRSCARSLGTCAWAGAAARLAALADGVNSLFAIAKRVGGSPSGWDDVADLDGAVGDEHAVDQQFEQRPLLIEVCFPQALPNTAAERLGMGCQPGRLTVPLRIVHEVMVLAFQRLQPGLGIAPTPLKLGQGAPPRRDKPL